MVNNYLLYFKIRCRPKHLVLIITKQHQNNNRNKSKLINIKLDFIYENIV